MYRTKAIYAWWPRKVWKPVNTDPGTPKVGEWVTIWLRKYYIVEKADIISDCGGILVEINKWVYYVGDYYYKQDADNVIKAKQTD